MSMPILSMYLGVLDPHKNSLKVIVDTANTLVRIRVLRAFRDAYGLGDIPF